MAHLALALANRHAFTASITDLNGAISMGRQALKTQPQHAERADWLVNLANALLRRFERTQKLDDLDELIATAQDVVNTVPPEHPDNASWLNNLGLTLRTRYEITGSTKNLDEAIDRGLQAKALTPTDHVELTTRLSNLVLALTRRFEVIGAMNDLQQAIEIGIIAVECTTLDHPNWMHAWNNLAIAYRMQYERTGSTAGLSEAIRLITKAAESAPVDHPSKWHCQITLASTLHVKFEATGDIDELTRAHRAALEALNNTSADHPARSQILGNLSVFLHSLYQQTSISEYLDDAIIRARQAIDSTPMNHYSRGNFQRNLAVALQSRYERTENPSDLNELVAIYQEVLDSSSTPTSIRIYAARRAADLMARSQPGRGARLLERAVELLPLIAPHQLQRSDQQHSLSNYDGLAADAAALILRDQSIPREHRALLAARQLESGRAVLLGQALRARSDLADLTDQHPDMADQFSHLRNLLDLTIDDELSITESSLRLVNRHRLAREFEDLLIRIRALPTFESFALPPNANELLEQANSGPIIFLNTSQYGSDALIITTNKVDHLPLPELDFETVEALVDIYSEAIHVIHSHRTAPSNRILSQRLLVEILEWLWDNIADPILQLLGYHAPAATEVATPRTWWIPIGPLGLLPVHAAGYHTLPDTTYTVMDRTITSYTPTVSALRYSRRYSTNAKLPADAAALVVAMSETPDIPWGSLHHACAEARVVADHLTSSVILSAPSHASADFVPTAPPTRADVLRLLPDWPIAHFACHSFSDPVDPSRSRLLLHDHLTNPLTVSTLIPISLEKVQLAYLSVCESASISNISLADEAIHLTSAFQLAGYPHVIGTLWKINDEISVEIAGLFYSNLKALTSGVGFDFSKSSAALHQAIRTVRDAYRTKPSLWAAYLHTGM